MPARHAHPSRGIDHLVLSVRDLAAAAARYEQLGFTCTPRAEHPWGSANRLVQLHGSFLELLTVAHPDRIVEHAPGRFSFGAWNRDWLAHREGFSMLVFEGSDSRADRDEFAAAGLRDVAPFDFEREARLPDGSTRTVAFSLAFALSEQTPDAPMFTCHQHAPELFWKPDYQRHENGLTSPSSAAGQRAAGSPSAWSRAACARCSRPCRAPTRCARLTTGGCWCRPRAGRSQSWTDRPSPAGTAASHPRTHPRARTSPPSASASTTSTPRGRCWRAADRHASPRPERVRAPRAVWRPRRCRPPQPRRKPSALVAQALLPRLHKGHAGKRTACPGPHLRAPPETVPPPAASRARAARRRNPPTAPRAGRAAPR